MRRSRSLSTAVVTYFDRDAVLRALDDYVRALAAREPDVYATVGIHPHDAGEATEADFDAL